MAKVTNARSKPVKRPIPAPTPEGREQQLIQEAMDLVEERILNGTASSQETTHFLKLGSSKHQLEMERLREENKLLREKTESLKAAKDSKLLYEEALRAFRTYSGQDEDLDDEDY